jgi:hypothetical protein
MDYKAFVRTAAGKILRRLAAAMAQRAGTADWRGEVQNRRRPGGENCNFFTEHRWRIFTKSIIVPVQFKYMNAMGPVRPHHDRSNHLTFSKLGNHDHE